MSDPLCECGRPNTFNHFCLRDDFAKVLAAAIVRRNGLSLDGSGIATEAKRVYNFAEALMKERLKRRKESEGLDKK